MDSIRSTKGKLWLAVVEKLLRNKQSLLQTNLPFPSLDTSLFIAASFRNGRHCASRGVWTFGMAAAPLVPDRSWCCDSTAESLFSLVKPGVINFSPLLPLVTIPCVFLENVQSKRKPSYCIFKITQVNTGNKLIGSCIWCTVKPSKGRKLENCEIRNFTNSQTMYLTLLIFDAFAKQFSQFPVSMWVIVFHHDHAAVWSWPNNLAF